MVNCSIRLHSTDNAQSILGAIDRIHKGPNVVIYLSWVIPYHYWVGAVQDCNNSSALAMELLQSCTTKPSIYTFHYNYNLLKYVEHARCKIEGSVNNCWVYFVDSVTDSFLSIINVWD